MPFTPEFLPAWAPAEGAERARALFRDALGYEAHAVYRAPGRVNLIGEHTDYNGGLALPIALPHATYIAAAQRGDRRIRLLSAQMKGQLEVDLDQIGPAGTAAEVVGWAAYVAGVFWALEHPDTPDTPAGLTLPGFDIAVDSCVPFGAGLSSSAALECAVAVMLNGQLNLGISGAGLAHACVRAENVIAGAPTGGMDQSASLLATPGHALRLDCRTGATRQVPFDLDAAGKALLVIDTRAEHQLVDGQYAARREACEAAARELGVGLLAELVPPAPEATPAWPQISELIPASAASAHPQKAPAGALSDDVITADNSHNLDFSRYSESLETRSYPPAWVSAVTDRLTDATQAARTRHVLTEIARTDALVKLLGAGALADSTGLGWVGALLDGSHESLRYDYEVTCSELNIAVEAARNAGAYGARMTGGGFGGSAIALVDAQRVEGIAKSIAMAAKVSGFATPSFLVAKPAESAGKVN